MPVRWDSSPGLDDTGFGDRRLYGRLPKVARHLGKGDEMPAFTTRGKRQNKHIHKNAGAARAVRMAVHGAVEMLEQRVLFSTLIVNSTDDNITDTSVLTLREAVGLVNGGGNP